MLAKFTLNPSGSRISVRPPSSGGVALASLATMQSCGWTHAPGMCQYIYPLQPPSACTHLLAIIPGICAVYFWSSIHEGGRLYVLQTPESPVNGASMWCMHLACNVGHACIALVHAPTQLQVGDLYPLWHPSSRAFRHAPCAHSHI